MLTPEQELERLLKSMSYSQALLMVCTLARWTIPAIKDTKEKQIVRAAIVKVLDNR